MRPEPGQVLHFSEDPTITRFTPHVAATARTGQRYVWAVDAARAPDYWFPRQCPRALAWVEPTTSARDRDLLVGLGGGHRVHAVEYRWLAAIRSVRLYAYRFDAADFEPHGTAPHAHVCVRPVRPLGPAEPVGGLLGLHERAGIQLRVLDSLWPFWDAVTAGTAGFSGIRLRNAAPRPDAGAGTRVDHDSGRVGSGPVQAQGLSRRSGGWDS